MHFVNYKNDFEDVERLLAETKRKKASIVYLANPDNPMGTFHTDTVIEDMINNLPERSMLCLDEAYSEFVPKNIETLTINEKC